MIFPHSSESLIRFGEYTQKKDCVPPKSVVNARTELMAEMFGSHDWVVQEGKPFGTAGVLIRFRCSRCNADGMATIGQID